MKLKKYTPFKENILYEMYLGTDDVIFFTKFIAPALGDLGFVFTYDGSNPNDWVEKTRVAFLLGDTAVVLCIENIDGCKEFHLEDVKFLSKDTYKALEYGDNMILTKEFFMSMSYNKRILKDNPFYDKPNPVQKCMFPWESKEVIISNPDEISKMHILKMVMEYYRIRINVAKIITDDILLNNVYRVLPHDLMLMMQREGAKFKYNEKVEPCKAFKLDWNKNSAEVAIKNSKHDFNIFEIAQTMNYHSSKNDTTECMRAFCYMCNGNFIELSKELIEALEKLGCEFIYKNDATVSNKFFDKTKDYYTLPRPNSQVNKFVIEKLFELGYTGDRMFNGKHPYVILIQGGNFDYMFLHSFNTYIYKNDYELLEIEKLLGECHEIDNTEQIPALLKYAEEENTKLLGYILNH